jgi:hypothetical protein
MEPAEPGGIEHFGAELGADVRIQRPAVYRRAEVLAARAVGATIILGFAYEGFIHGMAS